MINQVRNALTNYSNLPQVPLDSTTTPELFYLATPDRLAFALGWAVANGIVQARFRTSGIDAIPIYHPEFGWDRFLLTRRLSGAVFKHRPANEFGALMLDGDNAPRLISPGGKTLLTLRKELISDPEDTMRRVLGMIPVPPVDTSDADRLTAREKSPRYPVFFNAVTELILENPGLVAAREIYIDDQQIEGQYHPLYLHAVELTPGGPGDRHGMNLATTTHNWFQLQIGDLFAFFDRRGTRAIYRTDTGTWSRVRKQLVDEPDDRVKVRIAGWLRLNGTAPDPEVD